MKRGDAMSLLTSLFIAVAASLDGFAIGISYGLKKISIPWISQIIIALATSIAFIIAILFGNILKVYLNPTIAKYLGAFILFLLGIISILQAKINESTVKGKALQTIATLRVKSLSIIIEILAEPSVADIDASGIIDPKEALLLGVALALDTFGIGLGIGITGVHILLTVVFITFASLLFLSAGLHIGYRYKFNTSKLKFLPGCLLICIALVKVI